MCDLNNDQLLQICLFLDHLMSMVSLFSWLVFNQVKPKKERCQVVNNFILYLVLRILWGASADENSTLQLQIRRLKQLLKTIKKSNQVIAYLSGGITIRKYMQDGHGEFVELTKQFLKQGKTFYFACTLRNIQIIKDIMVLFFLLENLKVKHDLSVTKSSSMLPFHKWIMGNFL